MSTAVTAEHYERFVISFWIRGALFNLQFSDWYYFIVSYENYSLLTLFSIMHLRQRQRKPQSSQTQTLNQRNQTQLRSGRRISSASGTRLQTGTPQTSSPPKTEHLLEQKWGLQTLLSQLQPQHLQQHLQQFLQLRLRQQVPLWLS